MSATLKPVELPTEKEYSRIHEDLQAAHDAVESLVWRLDDLMARVDLVPSEESPRRLVPKTIDAASPNRPATFADLGMLWDFRHGLDSKVAELQRFTKTLDEVLPRGLRRGGRPMTAAERSAVAAEVVTATRQAFVEILEEQAQGARLAARFAHTCLAEQQSNEERSEHRAAYFRGQRDALDAIADQFDRIAFNLTQGGAHAR